MAAQCWTVPPGANTGHYHDNDLCEDNNYTDDHHLYREDQTGDCNAFRYLEDSGSCDLAELTFLEDPNVGESPLEVMQ